MPGLTVHHQLSEFAQTHVHRAGDAIQPPHPLSFPSPPAFNLRRIRVFFKELVLCISWSRYWNFRFSISPSNEYSGLMPFSIDWFGLLAIQGTLKSSPAPQLKSINPLALSLPYGRTLTSTYDYGKNNGLTIYKKLS